MNPYSIPQLQYSLAYVMHILIARLRELLKSEEEQYLQEISSKQETVLERQAKMRERARMLRERRESERLALVEKKLDQRWR